MIARRSFTLATLSALLLAAPARAQSAEQATAFVDQLAKALIAVIDGPLPADQKRVQLQQIVDRQVDVDGIARFCLGRYWRTASPDQQKQYLELFHHVLMTSITSRMGEYKGVTYTLGRATPGDGGVTVASVITRPNQAPANVGWVVGTLNGETKILDVIAEGTSLRLTQRSDYAAFITHNGDNVQALLDAMRRQAAQPG